MHTWGRTTHTTTTTPSRTLSNHFLRFFIYWFRSVTTCKCAQKPPPPVLLPICVSCPPSRLRLEITYLLFQSRNLSRFVITDICNLLHFHCHVAYFVSFVPPDPRSPGKLSNVVLSFYQQRSDLFKFLLKVSHSPVFFCNLDLIDFILSRIWLNDNRELLISLYRPRRNQVVVTVPPPFDFKRTIFAQSVSSWLPYLRSRCNILLYCINLRELTEFSLISLSHLE